MSELEVEEPRPEEEAGEVLSSPGFEGHLRWSEMHRRRLSFLLHHRRRALSSFFKTFFTKLLQIKQL